MMWVKIKAYAGPSSVDDMLVDDYFCDKMASNRLRTITASSSYGSGAAIKLITTGGSAPCSTYTGKSDTVVVSKPW